MLSCARSVAALLLLSTSWVALPSYASHPGCTATTTDELRGLLGGLSCAVVHVEAGAYTGPIDVTRTVSVLGPDTGIAAVTATAAPAFRVNTAGISVTISGFSVTGTIGISVDKAAFATVSENTAVGTLAAQTAILVDEVTGPALVADNVVRGAGRGIQVTRSEAVRIQGNAVEQASFNNGIDIATTPEVWLSDNSVEVAGAGGISVSGATSALTLLRNTIGSAAAAGITLTNPNSATVLSNTVTSATGGIAVTGATGLLEVSGNTIVGAGTGGGISVATTAPTTISRNSVLSATDGIRITSATAPLYLMGNTVSDVTGTAFSLASSVTTTVEGNMVGRAGGGGIDVNGIGGLLTISANSVSETVGTAIATSSTQAVEVSDNAITASATAIAVAAAPTVTVSANEIVRSGRGMSLDSLTGPAAVDANRVRETTSGDAISLASVVTATLTANVVDRAETSALSVLTAGGEVTVLSNTVARSVTQHGISIEDARAARVEGNTVSSANESGIRVVNVGLTSAVTANTISTTTAGPGILLDGAAAQLSVSGNRIDGANGGIRLDDDDFGAPLIEGNTVIRSQNGVALASGTNFAVVPLTIRFNRLIGNVQAGISHGGAGTVDATANWWGCNAGPGAAGCDVAAGPLDTTPWLVLTLTAVPNLIGTDESSMVVADVTRGSDGAPTGAASGLPRIPASFGTTLGTLTPLTTDLANGRREMTYTSDALGFAIISGTVDSETLTQTVEVTLPNIRPTAVLGATPTKGRTPLEVVFDGSGSSDPDQGIATFLLDYGDGSTPTAGTGTPPAVLRHTYEEAGTLAARLTVTDTRSSTHSATALISTNDPTRFYFAEGTTLAGFSEFLLFASAGGLTVTVDVTYFFDDGTPPLATIVGIPPRGRTTIDVASVASAGRTGVAVIAVADLPFVAERAIFFERGFPAGIVNGAHTAVGVDAPRRSWTFAEGSTLTGIQEYLTFVNPGPRDSNVQVAFGFEGGGVTESRLIVPAGRRYTLDVNATIGIDVNGHSTFVTSDEALLVERPMYVNRDVGDDLVFIDGGHVAFGSRPAQSWSFAEGNVLPGFFTYLAVANADPTFAADVNIDYAFADGTSQARGFTIGPGGRRTVKVFDATDPAGIGRDVSDPVSRGVSMRVSTSAPRGIVAERALYFHRDFGSGSEIRGGHATPGAASLSARWTFAEGSTLPGFLPFFTFYNPGDKTAAVNITYLTDDGLSLARTVAVAARTRVTVQAFASAEEGGLGREVDGFGTVVESSVPVLVERSIYVDRELPGLPRIRGGTVAAGVAG